MLTNGVETLSAKQVGLCAWRGIRNVRGGSRLGVGLIEVDRGGRAFMPGVAGVVDA